MRIYLSGACGMIGSLLAEYLIISGHTVLAVDSLLYKGRHIAENLERMYGKSRFQFFELDVTNDYTAVGNIIKTCQVAIPAAAIVGFPACDKYQAQSQRVNVDAIKHTVDCCKDGQLVIYPNSNSGLGDSNGGLATEDTPVNPSTLYAKQKVEGENIIRDYHNHIVYRLGTLFGVSHRTRLDLLVNTICWEAYWDKVVPLYQGNFNRNFVHVGDVCRAFGHAIENEDKMKNRVFNLGMDSANTTKRGLVEKIAKYLKFDIKEIDAQDPDSRNYRVDSSLLYSTGFHPYYDLDYGIQELIEWFKTLPVNKLDREAYVKYNRNTSI